MTSLQLLTRSWLRAAIAASQAADADWFVATTGNDTTGDGTVGNPYATIVKASQEASAGDIIAVAPGTYGADFTTTLGGTSGARVKYVSSTPWGAVIDGGGNDERAWQNDGNYVDIAGFTVTNSVYIGFYNRGANCRIYGSHIYDLVPPDNNGGNGGAGITEHDTLSSNNEYFNNVVHGINPTDENHQIHGIYVASPNAKIYNNIIYDITARGVQAFHNASAIVVANNLLFNCNTGILMNNSAGDISGCVAVNNIVRDCTLGIRLYGAGSNTIDSNITVGNTINYHDADSSNDAIATNRITSDPLLVDYQIDGSGDYHLTSSSPARGAGNSSGAPAEDHDGVARGSPPDIGPYEYVA